MWPPPVPFSFKSSMDHHRHSSSPPSTLLNDISQLLLRLGAGVGCLFFHGWAACRGGWEYLWRQAPWALMSEMEEFPGPATSATVIALVAAAGSLFLIVGLFTRLSAAVLLVCALAGAFVYLQFPAAAERFLLYAVLYGTLLAAGAGAFSLDAAFSGRRRR